QATTSRRRLPTAGRCRSSPWPSPRIARRSSPRFAEYRSALEAGEQLRRPPPRFACAPVAQRVLGRAQPAEQVEERRSEGIAADDQDGVPHGSLKRARYL